MVVSPLALSISPPPRDAPVVLSAARRPGRPAKPPAETFTRMYVVAFRERDDPHLAYATGDAAGPAFY